MSIQRKNRYATLRTSGSAPSERPTPSYNNGTDCWSGNSPSARTQELGRSLVDLRSLATALDAAEQCERTRLATELHDYLAQLLVLGRMKIGLLQRLPLPLAGDEMVQEVGDVLTQSLHYCQTLMAELSPPILQDKA